MPDAVIVRVDKLAWNEKYEFIFADRIVSPIVYIYTTVFDRDASDSNKNWAPQ